MPTKWIQVADTTASLVCKDTYDIIDWYEMDQRHWQCQALAKVSIKFQTNSCFGPAAMCHAVALYVIPCIAKCCAVELTTQKRLGHHSLFCSPVTPKRWASTLISTALVPSSLEATIPAFSQRLSTSLISWPYLDTVCVIASQKHQNWLRGQDHYCNHSCSWKRTLKFLAARHFLCKRRVTENLKTSKDDMRIHAPLESCICRHHP